MKSTGVFLSNDVIDKVLKKFRFSHGNPLGALEFFKLTGDRRGFYHSPFSLDTMLYILGRSRKFDHIWDVLVEIKKKDRNLISPRTVQVVLGRIAKLCSVRIRMTVESFRKFKKLFPEFDTTCFNALLRTLCQEKSMSDARNVYHRLKTEFNPNLQTFNILLSGWKSAEEAESFFREMEEMGVKPDVVSYNCLIDVYCKGSEMKKAYEMIGKMRDEDILPDVITIGDAYDLLDEMEGKELNPNSTTYNLFFRVFYWSNDLRSSWNLYLRMMDACCLPNTNSCMFLIRLCGRHERVDLALKLWGDMVDKSFGSYSLVSDVLFDLLCDMGKLVEAEKCFLEMIEMGQKPSFVSFKRIKVLMELAKDQDGIRNLSEKMAVFEPSVQVPQTAVKMVPEQAKNYSKDNIHGEELREMEMDSNVHLFHVNMRKL
ncbi:unnamed protein product [Linum tenue]|uniref:Pentatricopeptide repeat-containing protein n=1 Tax=Linum tenue TaxID=586396 RepID=A0AAV0GWM1_9ROSI|nr:unnamed protein product [Linum tenue]